MNGETKSKTKMKTTTKNHGTCDIVSSRAWRDDDYAEDWDGGWRIEHLWCYTGKPRYTVCDSDGNHEPFDGRGVTKYMREAEESWRAYGEWCAETGRDPLMNFHVEHKTKHAHECRVYFTSWIGASKYGLAVIRGKIDGKEFAPKDFPKYLTEYLCLKKCGGRWCMDGIHTADDMLCIDALQGNSFTCTVEELIPRSEGDIARDIRAIIDRKEAA